MTGRPSGIIIIAGLQILGAIVTLLLLFGPLSDYIFFENTLVNELYRIYAIIMVVISLITAYGLLKGMKWAWILTIIFYSIYIVFYAITLKIFNIFYEVLVIYYLTRPHVKTYFQKPKLL